MSKNLRPIKKPRGSKNTSHNTNHGKNPSCKWVKSGIIKPIIKDEKQAALTKARRVRRKERRRELRAEAA